MPLSLAATYVVQAAAADRGYRIAFKSFNSPLAEGPDIGRSPPGMVALAGDGRTLAFVEQNSSGDRIVVMRDGRRDAISQPPRFALGVYGSQGLPDKDLPYRVSDIRLTQHGTLFASVSAYFSGAYTGVREEAFVYQRRGWHQIRDPFSHPDPNCRQCPNNVIIAAAQSSGHFALTSDYKNYHPLAGSMFDANSNLYVSRSAVVDGRTTTQLGIGNVLALSGSYAAGYVDAFEHRPGTLALTATRWAGVKRTSLGLGVAYDVDSDGAVVGDDRTSWDAVGHPTLWTGTRQTQLIPNEGSAFAIYRNLIVGTTGGRAFGMSRTYGSRSVRFFERLAGHRWHIATAFAIGSNGRVLALGSQGGGPLSILLLTPVIRRK